MSETSTSSAFKHVPVATPNIINGEQLPEGITREELNKMWQDDCYSLGFKLPRENNQSMPSSRTDLLAYYISKLRIQQTLDV